MQVVDAIDRRLASACVSSHQLRLGTDAKSGGPEGEAATRRQIVNGSVVAQLLSPRLVAAHVASGGWLEISDLCAFLGDRSAWCGADEHLTLCIYKDGVRITSSSRPASEQTTGDGGCRLAERIDGMAGRAAPRMQLTDDLDVLDAIVGDRGRFADAWGHHTFVCRNADRGGAGVPIGIEDLEYIIDRDLRAEFVHAARDGAGVPVMTAGMTVVPSALGSMFNDGTTLVLDALHLLDPQLAEVSGRLQVQLGQPVQSNVYITPRQAGGFGQHKDPHDTLIIQLAGTKDWYLGSRPMSERHRDLTLEPGDVLYIPAGVTHAARCTDTASAHLTFGIRRRSDADIRTAALRRLAKIPIGLADERPHPTTGLSPEALARQIAPQPADLSHAIGAAIAEQDDAFIRSIPISARGALADVVLERRPLVWHPLASTALTVRPLSIDGRRVRLAEDVEGVSAGGAPDASLSARSTAVLTALRMLRSGAAVRAASRDD